MKETKRLTDTAAATVTPNSRKNLPTMPPMNATGTKTQRVLRVVESTAKPISLVPRFAAR